MSQKLNTREVELGAPLALLVQWWDLGIITTTDERYDDVNQLVNRARRRLDRALPAEAHEINFNRIRLDWRTEETPE